MANEAGPANIPDYEPPTYEQVAGNNNNTNSCHAEMTNAPRTEETGPPVSSTDPIIQLEPLNIQHSYNNPVCDVITNEPTPQPNISPTYTESSQDVTEYHVRIDDRLIFDFDKMTCHKYGAEYVTKFI